MEKVSHPRRSSSRREIEFLMGNGWSGAARTSKTGNEKRAGSVGLETCGLKATNVCGGGINFLHFFRFHVIKSSQLFSLP